VSAIRKFDVDKKVFDAIICDVDDEIKVVGFNEAVDEFYSKFGLNQVRDFDMCVIYIIHL